MLPFFLPFRFQSETVRLIIENMLVHASVFQCVHLGWGVVSWGRVEASGPRSISHVSPIASFHKHFPSHL